MNSPKKLLFIGVATLTATLVFAQALTPEQRKAAEDALRGRMQELNVRESAPASKAAPTDKKTQKAEAEARRKAEAEAKKKAEAEAKLAADARKKAEAEAKKAADEAKRRADAEAKRLAAEAKAAGKPAPKVVVEQKLPVAKPVAVKAAVVPVPAPVILSESKLTPEQEAKAREALMVKMAELNARDSRPVATKVPETKVIVVKGNQTPTKTVVTSAPTPVKTAVVAAAPEVEGAKLTPEQEAKAREALRAKLASAPPAEAAGSKPLLRLRSSTVPEGLPISQEQWDQLASLTSAYKADKLTPQEYHARRAQIIGAKPAGGL